MEVETIQLEGFEDDSLRLLTIQVTDEQETAMEAFFQINGWKLIKEALINTLQEDGAEEVHFVTLRVTAEQEAAMEAFFQINKWQLIKEVSMLDVEACGDQQVVLHTTEEGQLGRVWQGHLTPEQHIVISVLEEDLPGHHSVPELPAPAAAAGVKYNGTTVEELQNISDIQEVFVSTGADGVGSQVITVMAEGGGNRSTLPQLVIQEISLPEGHALDNSLLVNKPRFVTPRGTVKPGEKVHKCHICGKTYKQAQSFNGHYQSHFGGKPFSCSICNMGFTLKAALVAHQSIHTGLKPFECHMCKKQFRRKDDMVSHIRTHTGEKPYECDLCGKKFKYRNQIPKHRRSHTGDKPYKCDTCEKAFTSNVHLKRHIRTHTGERPYACNTCPKAFTQYGHLQSHLRIHANIRPYQCSICERAFREKKVLKKHEALHTSERPYKCSTCGKGFLRQSNMELHAVMHLKGTAGAPKVRPRPRKRADAQMRDFVSDVLSNVVKVETGMQTETVIEQFQVPAENMEQATVSDNLSQFVNFAVESHEMEQRSRDASIMQQLPTSGSYAIVMQEDRSSGYLISMDENQTEVSLPQSVEIQTYTESGIADTHYDETVSDLVNSLEKVVANSTQQGTNIGSADGAGDQLQILYMKPVSGSADTEVVVDNCVSTSQDNSFVTSEVSSVVPTDNGQISLIQQPSGENAPGLQGLTIVQTPSNTPEVTNLQNLVPSVKIETDSSLNSFVNSSSNLSVFSTVTVTTKAELTETELAAASINALQDLDSVLVVPTATSGQSSNDLVQVLGHGGQTVVTAATIDTVPIDTVSSQQPETQF